MPDPPKDPEALKRAEEQARAERERIERIMRENRESDRIQREQREHFERMEAEARQRRIELDEIERREERWRKERDRIEREKIDAELAALAREARERMDREAERDRPEIEERARQREERERVQREERERIQHGELEGAAPEDADRLRRDAGNDRIAKQDAAEDRSRRPSSAPQTTPTPEATPPPATPSVPAPPGGFTPTSGSGGDVPLTTAGRVPEAADPRREAERIDRIGRQQGLDGDISGGVTDSDAEAVRDSLIREDVDATRARGGDLSNIEPPKEQVAPDEPRESVLEDLGELSEFNSNLAGGLAANPVDKVPVKGPPIDLPGSVIGEFQLPPLRLPGEASAGPFTRGCIVQAFSGSFIAIGLFILLWSMTGGRNQYDTFPSEPLVTVTLAPLPLPSSPATAAPSAAPTVALSAGPIVATQIETVTSYEVQGVRGSGLRYVWTNTLRCGVQTGADMPNFRWNHPHNALPNDCPAEPVHASTITVQITDAGGNQVVRTFPFGSAAQTGPVPPGGGVIAASSTPTTVPTTSARATTAAPTASSAPTTSGSDPNYPLAGLGGLMILGGGGLWFAGRKNNWFGGPVLQEEQREQGDPCVQERLREAQARARRDAARQRAQRIDQLRTDAERTRAEADRADRNEKASKDDRQSWWEDAQTGVRTYTNPDQRGRIERAEAAARAAREAADRAKSAFEAAGDGAESAQAQDELRQANAEWEPTDIALKECLRQNAAPPTPTPPTAPAPTPGPPTAGPGGPVTTPPPPLGPTQVRTCTPGQPKPGSERLTTHELRINDLRTARILISRNYLVTDEVAIEGFVDWLDFLNKSTKVGRTIHSFASGETVEGFLHTAQFPDFFTYFHKIGKMATDSVRTIVRTTSSLRQTGEYQIAYTVRLYKLTCRRWEECNAAGTGYVSRRGLTMRAAGTANRTTQPPIEVNVDHASVAGAVQSAINAMFGRLESENKRQEDDAKRFENACQ